MGNRIHQSNIAMIVTCIFIIVTFTPNHSSSGYCVLLIFHCYLSIILGYLCIESVNQICLCLALSPSRGFSWHTVHRHSLYWSLLLVQDRKIVKLDDMKFDKNEKKGGFLYITVSKLSPLCVLCCMGFTLNRKVSIKWSLVIHQEGHWQFGRK